MKSRITIIMILFPLLIFSQEKKKKSKERQTEKKISVTDYFVLHGLLLDSVKTPYLFYQVYDWKGTKYKYSGKSKKGVDCSGFVGMMYSNVYCVNLCGGSKDLWNVVKPVERKELAEGDILFFKIKKGQISHVGIYLGNDKFAHASVKSGVMISDLNEAYYKKYFYKGGRLDSLFIGE
jgi:murein DD-endopeptidase / murein LD-carboxypeptidase